MPVPSRSASRPSVLKPFHLPCSFRFLPFFFIPDGQVDTVGAAGSPTACSVGPPPAVPRCAVAAAPSQTSFCGLRLPTESRAGRRRWCPGRSRAASVPCVDAAEGGPLGYERTRIEERTDAHTGILPGARGGGRWEGRDRGGGLS